MAKTQKNIRHKSVSGSSVPDGAVPDGSVPDVANYDLHPEYHYSKYWEGRQYEHQAEIFAIKSLLKKAGFNKQHKQLTQYKQYKQHKLHNQGYNILDLGAGFGRLFSSYCKYFDNIFLGDYSTKELQDAIRYTSQYSKKHACNVNTYFVALNAYFLPFVNNVFDAVISVRLIHHIEQPKAFLQEIKRVLKPNGYVILEVANKNHIKAIVRNWLKRNFGYFKKKRILVEHNPQTSQGLTRGQNRYVFYNYNIKYILKIADQLGLKQVSVRQVSILRSVFLKKIFPTKFLVFLDRVYQHISWILNKMNLFLTPSVFLLLQKQENILRDGKGKDRDVIGQKLTDQKLLNILQCPQHGIKLNQGIKRLKCAKGCSYNQVGKIYDLRFPIITV